MKHGKTGCSSLSAIEAWIGCWSRCEIRKAELAWAGEYAGKWLDAAALSVSDADDPQLGQAAARFASELIATQESGGYLGIEPPARRGQGSDWDWSLECQICDDGPADLF